MAEIKLYKLPWRGIKLIVMSAAFVGIGIWMIRQPSIGNVEYAMGWLCIVFFGLCSLIGLYVVLDRRPQIIISETGVWDRMIRQNEIKWEQLLNAYPTNIYGQKFIAVVVTGDFVFRKKPSQWATKLNKALGAGEINLNLSQIKIDEDALSSLLNRLAKADKAERSSIIRNFNSNLKTNPANTFGSYITYAFTIVILWSLSLYSFTCFWIIFGIMGVTALIAKWYSGTSNNSRLRKYAETATYLGFMNMVLIFFFFQFYDHSSEKVGRAIAAGIEKYEQQHSICPQNISSIIDQAGFNFFEQDIAGKIQYKTTGKEYYLSLQYLNFNKAQYDPSTGSWH
ncbi:MAG: STM3941 family protein [Flavobacterium sp.]